MRAGLVLPMKLLLVLLATAAFAQVVREVGLPESPPVVFNDRGQLTLAVLYAIGTAITAWVTIRKDKTAERREERARLWLIEDRKAATEAAERTADRIRLELTQSQDKVALEAWMRADLLKASISENTEISREAFRVANNVNEKIAAVGAMRRSDNQLRRDEDVKDKQ